MADVQDVLIVGGGAAGYTAGIFAARDCCRALLLEKFSAGGPVTVDVPASVLRGHPRCRILSDRAAGP